MSPRIRLAVLTIAIACRGVYGDGVRTAAWAGKLYEADPEKLAATVDAALAQSPPAKLPSPMRAALFPLGTYQKVAPLAGRLVAQFPDDTKRVIILASWHPTSDHLPEDRRAMAGKAAIPSKSAYRTPLGDVRIDQAAASLRDQSACFADIPAAHFWEPAVEALLPFLQRRFADTITILPVVLENSCDTTLVAQALGPLLDEQGTLVVASAALPATCAADGVDILLRGNAEGLRPLKLADAAVLKLLLTLSSQRHWQGLAIDPTGLKPVTGDAQTELLTCGAIAFIDDANRVYLIQQAAAADWDDPATKAAFQDATRAATRAAFQGDLLSAPEQELLLWLARKSIAAKLAAEPLPPLPLYSDSLSQNLGCFVTLNKDGKLRGCIGTLAGNDSLAAGVQKNALSAAFEDKRFAPLTAAELPDVHMEISVLTAPLTLTYTDADDLLRQLTPGVHGVVLTYDGTKRATYLPQVWQQVQDKTLFLTNLCRKGGMPLDGWKDPKLMSVALYEAFTFNETK